MHGKTNYPQYRGLPSSSIRRPIGTVMLSLVIIVLGWFFASKLPLDLLPSITYPQIRAGVTYPGVEPQVLEEIVAKPLEAALAVTEGVNRIETEVQEGRVGVNLHFNYGTDIDVALQEASKNLDRARAALPEEANPPTIFKFDPSQIPVYEAAFSSETRDLISLRDWVDQRLRPQLLTVEGIASVDVSGGLVREVQVVLDQERLRSYGLTVGQVNEALRSANQDVAAGRVSSPTREVVGKTAGKFRTVEDVRQVPLNLAGGGHIPLGEVARVSDTHREQRLWARLNGVPAVRISVRKQPDANTVKVAEGVAERLEALQQSNFVPRDIAYRTIENQANFVRNSVNSVRDAALTGALLAMLVVLLFLGSLRKTFVIGTGIPLAILATFMMMGLGGLTLNIMSLGGLALGVGMLVDNSIVMLENIFRRKELGHLDPEEAAHAGAGEVQSAVIASTTTNLAAVVPFLLISGLSAMIFRELILTISFAILASLAVALTLVPMLSAQLGKVVFSSRLGETRPLRAFNGGIDRLRDLYRGIAPFALRWRWLVLGTAIAAFVSVIPLTRGLGNEFLPTVDDGGVSVFISLPPGSSAQETNRIAGEIERMVRQMPHVQDVFTSAGGFFFGNSTAEIGGRGSLSIRLVPVGQREMSAEEWVKQMQEKINARGFAGARIFVRPPRIRGLRTSTAGSDVAITLQGDDLMELQRLSEEVMQRVQGVKGLQNVQPSTEEASPQVAIELDRERAAALGLNAGQVGQTVRTALDGFVPTRYTEGNREYEVRVMLPRSRFTSPEDLESIALFPGQAGGAPIYLRDVARVYQTVGPTSILRENQNRVLRITGDVVKEESTVGEVNQEIRQRLEGLTLPEGYGLIYGGEEEAIRENNRALTVVMLLAVFLVFTVMAVQYESLINPLVIIQAIPLSLVGVVLALWATSTPLSAPVMLGVILLAGIVVNNAILLVEYIEEFRERPGSTLRQAVVDAGAVRLRPILMTTLTTLLGMLPLALGIGEGSELMQPLAISMVGGLSLSMLLTLFVVPSTYLILHGIGDRLKALLTGGEAKKHDFGPEPRPAREPAPHPTPAPQPALARGLEAGD